MNIKLCFYTIVVGVLCVVARPAMLLGQSKTMKTEDLVRESEVIVSGKIGELVPEWTANKARIQTRVTVAIDEKIKGTPQGNSITVIIPGGEIDGVGEWYSHSVSFAKDEDVVLFTQKERDGRYRITGGEHGKISVKKDIRTGSKTIPNIGTLQAFTAKIKDVVKSQQNAETRD